jgi:hypothetical protein
MFLLLYWLVGFISAVYLVLVDGTEGYLEKERPVSLLLQCGFFGIVTPITLMYTIYVIWCITDKDYRN